MSDFYMTCCLISVVLILGAGASVLMVFNSWLWGILLIPIIFLFLSLITDPMA